MKNFRFFLFFLILLLFFEGCKNGNKKENTKTIIIGKSPGVEELVGKGNAYFMGKRFDIAGDYYKKALNINNELPEVHFNLGLIYDKRFKYKEAIREYSTAINQRHGYIKAHLNLGLVLAKLKKYDEALKHIDWILSVEPENLGALYNRGLILHKSHSNKAIDAWEEYINIAKGIPSQLHHVNKAITYLQILEDTKE